MKLRRIGASVEYFFLKKRKVPITVPSDAAAKYLDDFLWKQPKESFLPHAVAEKKCTDEVVITTCKENLNHANVLINLCPELSPIASAFETVFELWDETTLEHRERSDKKFNDYAELGAEVELIL